MTLRIERSLAQDRAVIRLIGRVQREHLADLETEIQCTMPRLTLDLQEVTLVDVEAVSFLNRCEDSGVALLHCSPYIRRWMTRERAQRG